MKKILISLISIIAGVGFSQTPMDATDLTVTAAPLHSVEQTGQDVSLAVGLSRVPGVQIIPQGLPGGQSDISIRGSGFSGAGVSLGGLSLRNPQTEHFHAELPFPGSWLGIPSVYTGVNQALYGEGHLVGTVGLSPMPVSDRNLITYGLGDQGGFWLNGSAQEAVQTPSGQQIGLGAFAGVFEAHDVDLEDNNVETARGGAQAQWVTDAGQADLMLGHQDKTFGTRGYYGVNPGLPSEERTRDTLLFGQWQTFKENLPLQAAFLLRQFEDDYKLWLPSGLFRNQHRSMMRAAQVGSEIPLTHTVQVHGRVAVDQEEIESNALGDFDRSRLAVTLLPEWEPMMGVRIFAGVRGEVLEDSDNQLLPQVRVEWDPSTSFTVYADHSQSVRRPSYTELNYESPGSLGNSGLVDQTQEATELGFFWRPQRNTELSVAVFQRHTFNAVDWIRPDEEATRWQAANIGRVESTGVEVGLRETLRDGLDLVLTSTWLDKEADQAPYASRYFLDYAEWQGRILVDWTVADWMRLELAQAWRQQVANALRNDGGDDQSLASIALHLRCPEWDQVQFSFMVDNLWDDDYRTFPGQDTVTGRRTSASVTVDW